MAVPPFPPSISPSSFPKPSSEPFHSSPACFSDLPDPIRPKVSSNNNRQYPGPRASPLRAGCCCLLPCPSTNSINIRPGTGTLATSNTNTHMPGDNVNEMVVGCSWKKSRNRHPFSSDSQRGK
ncbi:hypothetical protein CKAH01_14804 [Colletotrichum kahawae]|uniref:Uncharacterized protein n=1 Tax=Colletotrichum kahawae TaxID=34407 RepID=A0AAD9YNK9_COLKA|nr:hypothetical protein CKAH01_14804 [Colletotrichum kahawae]